MDFEREGLLDDLQGEERQARERLLQRLVDDGVSLDDLRRAVAEDRLVLLPVERVLGGRYTAAEVEEKSGLDAEAVLRIRQRLGLSRVEADEPVFSDEDVEAAEAAKRFREAGFDDAQIGQITRVLGEGMSRLAATTTAAFGEVFLEPGDSEEEVAMRFAALAEQLAPALTPVLVAAFRAHVREGVARGMLGSEQRQTGQLPGAREMAVCFADLVGFTKLGGQLEVQDLGTVAGRLYEISTETAKGSVRLIKTIGDAAMFVAEDPGEMVDAALALIEAADQAELPALRAGVALGQAEQRAGDFFGHAVNLASRVTGAARPRSVLCTQEVRDATAERFAWSFAGKHRLKGIKDQLPLHRARRLDADDEEDDSDSARRPKEGRPRKRESS